MKTRDLPRRATTLLLLFCALTSALVAIAACSSSDDSGSNTMPPAEDYTGSCSALASACHSYAKTSAIGHECHELGHAGDIKACGPRKAECLAACPPVEAGAEKDAAVGNTDAGADGAAEVDGGPDASAGCASYCDCLAATCGSQMGYPFATPDQCMSACSTQSVDEKTCFPKFCAQAKTLADKGHACEHAWGAFGLDECDTL